MIPPEIKDKIIDASKGDLDRIVEQFVELKPSGASKVGKCPLCRKEKKLSVTTGKDIWKCFSCNEGGAGATSFLMKTQDMEFVQAIKYLADFYSITWDERPKRKKPTSKVTFRDLQLRESGLEEADQRFTLKVDKQTEKQIDRYESATIDQYGNVVAGDDMVMHYITLDGQYTTYQQEGKGKDKKLQRVRWQVPENHKDKNGNPVKYKSPYKSGSHLWITNVLYQKFKRKTPFDRLFIQEGEKKADKASKHGMISVGIMGINNFAMNNVMPHDFQRILNTCNVKEVVFVLDSDYDNISNSIDKPVESRPKQFLSAARKFQDYFYQFQQHNIKVKTYLAYVKPGKPNIKGLDDLLVLLRGDEQELVEDFNKAVFHPEGKGEHIDCINITGYSELQLRKLFHLDSKESFFNHHITALKERPWFRYGNIKWKYNPESEEFELDQPLLPDEEFWTDESYETNTGRRVKKLSFNYGNCYHFLRNRGFGRFAIANNSKYRFVKFEQNIVKEVEPFQIKDHVIEFTEGVGKKDVLELLYRGAKMYLGPDSLSNLKYIMPEFHQSGKGVQYMYFKSKYWKITEEGIKESPIDKLDKAVWQDNIIDFDANLQDPHIDLTLIDESFLSDLALDEKKCFMPYYDRYMVEILKDADKSDFFQYLFNTSNFFFNSDLQKKKEPFVMLPGQGHEATISNMMEVYQHLLSKMTAVGYLLHRYRDSSTLKAVVAMDGKLSEVGQSNGRTGKSILGDAMERLMPTVTIPGKRNKLTEDDFLFSKVDERTRLVFVDDARTNLDFEFFFPMITGRLDVNRKGKDAFSLTGNDVPKLLITTNHALNGEGSSFRDRQHLIAFSDWYSDEHKPVDDFGRLFFDEWDHDEWNRFYNLMAECLVLYFRLGLVPAPDGRLEKRRLRQSIGESMIDWAETYYDPQGDNINAKQTRVDVFNHFINAYPKAKRYIDNIKFKRKLKAYCVYKGLEFNPGYPGKKNSKSGGDIKQGGIEYFIIADEHYEPGGYDVNNDD